MQRTLESEFFQEQNFCLSSNMAYFWAINSEAEKMTVWESDNTDG